MSRTWKRKTVMEGGQLITLKRLIKVGSSFALVIPMDYVRYKCSPDKDNGRWVKVKWDYGTGKLEIDGFQGGDQ